MNLELHPPQPQPHRFSTCDRHPDENVTGFCASCLRERLAGLAPATINTDVHRKTTATEAATSALKSIFKSAGDRNKPSSSSSSSASFLPELRRCKSFSGGRGERFSGVLEPQRRSCDVRGRNTLWCLFNLDDDRKGETIKEGWGEIEVEKNRNLGFSGVQDPVFESREEEEEEEEEEVLEEVVVEQQNDEELRVSEDVIEERIQEIEEIEEEEVMIDDEMKKMKDHIDLESQNNKRKGSFWLAATVLSKKLQKWRKKQKMKKNCNGGDSAAMPVKKQVGPQFRETQSEIADYGYGRRSCDTDPRFSLDAGRMSLDDPRYSWDEPRASWDGYLIGKMFPRIPPMGSVIEDDPVLVPRSDNQIPVEEPMNSSPGGSAQTRDFYSDPFQRRRKSLDRSNSIRKTAEVDEMKSVSNAKVSPATNELFHGTKALVTERDLRDSNSSSLRDDRSESFESAFRDSGSVIDGRDRKGSKKSRRWSKGWNIWSLIHKRNGSKNGDEERYCRGNVIQRSFSESWPELRSYTNGEAKVGAFNRSVSSRNFSNSGGLFGSRRSSNGEANGNGKKRREEITLERNRSARYSPNDVDNGFQRFNLTPLRGSRKSGSGKGKPPSSHSIARSVMRLY